MKAARIKKFGAPEVIEIVDTPPPEIGSDEVLIRNFYSSVNPVDWKIRNGVLKIFFGFRLPLTLGFDVAGEVVEVAPSVTKCKIGDRVFCMTDFFRMGAYAEYVRAKEKHISLIPENLGYKEAGAVPLAGLAAYQALHYKGEVKAGDHILINGASGGVGTFAVQIAKAAGAKVTAVCGTENIELVRTLGADRVIDYKKQDMLQLPTLYHIIFDTVATLSYFRAKKRLTPTGCYITTLPNKLSNVVSFFLTLLTSRRSKLFNVHPSGKDLDVLARLLREKKVKPVIDREYTLEQIREAHRYSEAGHARGKIVVKIADPPPRT